MVIRIRELREEKGMQQKELAIDLCVSQPTVSDWESGRKVPSARSTQKLADYFNVSIDYLLGRDEKKPAPTDGYRLNEREKELIRLFRELNQEGQELLVDTADTMVSSDKYKKSATAQLGKAKGA